MVHACHAFGCGATTPPRLLMCARHWRLVPPALQRRVWATYRPGQERDKQPSAAYLAAQRAAIAAVAAAEGKPLPVWHPAAQLAPMEEC